MDKPTRDNASTLKENHGVDVSHTLIFQVAYAVLDEVEQWQNRSLESVYPIIYMDSVIRKIIKNRRIFSKDKSAIKFV